MVAVAKFCAKQKNARNAIIFLTINDVVFQRDRFMKIVLLYIQIEKTSQNMQRNCYSNMRKPKTNSFSA